MRLGSNCGGAGGLRCTAHRGRNTGRNHRAQLLLRRRPCGRHGRREERSHDLLVPTGPRIVQRRLPDVVLLPRVRPAPQEAMAELQAALGGCPMQHCPLRRLPVHRRPAIMLHRDGRRVHRRYGRGAGPGGGRARRRRRRRLRRRMRLCGGRLRPLRCCGKRLRLRGVVAMRPWRGRHGSSTCAGRRYDLRRPRHRPAPQRAASAMVPRQAPRHGASMAALRRTPSAP